MNTTKTGRKTAAGDHPAIAEIAWLLADESRASIVFALTDDRALPASMLATEAGVSTSTASGHLAKLVDGGLITVEQHGRYRYFRLSGGRVAAAVEALAAIAPQRETTGLRGYNRLQRLKSSRTCYDHLAGHLGTQLMSWLDEHDAITRTDGNTGTGRAAGDRLSSQIKHAPYELGPNASNVFTRWDIDLDTLKKRRRPLIRVCVDWTEQAHHLAGGLGANILGTFIDHKWVRTTSRPREIEITPAGEKALDPILSQ
jgi:DNA-binding transcriptional ArsR family regulator